MSSSIHTALHHHLTMPSWLVAAFVAAVLAIGAVAVFSGSTGTTSPSAAEASAPYVSMPTTCVDAGVVGHC